MYSRELALGSATVGWLSQYLGEEPPLLVSRGEEIHICLKCYRNGDNQYVFVSFGP